MLYTVKLMEFNTDEIVIIDLCMQLCQFDSKMAFECVDNMPYILAESVEMEKVKQIREAFEKEGAILEVVPIKGSSNQENNHSNNQSIGENLDLGAYNSIVSIEDTFKENALQSQNKEQSKKELSNPYEGLALDSSKSMNLEENSSYNTPYRGESLAGRTSYGEEVSGASTPYRGESLAGRTAYGEAAASSSTPYGGESLAGRTAYGEEVSGASAPYRGESLAGNSAYGSAELGMNTSFGGDRLPPSPSYEDNDFLNSANSNSVYKNASDDLGKQVNVPDKSEEEEDSFEISDNDSKQEIDLRKPPQEILSQDNNVLKIGAAYDEDCMQINTEQYSDKNTSSSSEDMKKLFNEKAKKPVDTNECDNLFDLSRLGAKNKPQNTNSYEKEQVICPNCGSTFVSSKKSQGLFGTKKIKYVCEACKTKF